MKIVIVVAFIVAVIIEVSNGQEDFRFDSDLLSDEAPGSKDYDHEAFLGEDLAEEYDDMVPEESQNRLGEIFTKIDVDNDGNVDIKELEKWIAKTQENYIGRDTGKRLEKLDLDENGSVSWEEYFNVTYGKLKDDEWDTKEKDFSYRDMLNKDKNRWKVADTDNDDSCNLDELKAFCHPQHFDRMKNLVFEETVAELDKDQDGFIDIDEYIGDVYKPENENESEPEWVGAEREQFKNDRDKNSDGRLDEQEIRDWVTPDSSDYALDEAKHLIAESDSNQDGVLTKKEVIDNFDTFVGSQATDWGKMFEGHDEF